MGATRVTARAQLEESGAATRPVQRAPGLRRVRWRETHRALILLEAAKDPHAVLTGIAEELIVRILAVCGLPGNVDPIRQV